MAVVANAPVVIDWLAQPCSLGDRQRALAQLHRERQRLAGQRRREGQVRQAAHLEERPRHPARVAKGLLEVLPSVLGAAGPQLRDPEVEEREGAIVGWHPRLAALRPGAQRRIQAARGLLRSAHIAVSAGELGL
jgi:hypothetical protein